MLGMIPGNGHPYSWSAIINGYDPKEMASCPYESIPVYLGAQPLKEVKVPNAQVTHIWTDVLDEARLVAKASLIPNVVDQPEKVIGQVDGVFISTDDGYEHVRRARPFVEAGIPVFIDKPLATSIKDLQTFIDWEKNGCPILSSSGARYMQGLDNWDKDKEQYGELRWIASGMTKYWENYAIHAIQPLYRMLGPGFHSVRLESQHPKYLGRPDPAQVRRRNHRSPDLRRGRSTDRQRHQGAEHPQGRRHLRRLPPPDGRLHRFCAERG